MAARNEDTPSIREIAELTARLRRLSAAGRDADPVERAAFLSDKDALIARIEAATQRAGTPAGAEHIVRPDTAARTGEPPGDERSALDDDGEWFR
jgi:hypothetical protein